MKHITELRRILLGGDQQTRSAKAKKLGTTTAYIEKLAGGWGSPSIALMDKLRNVYPGLTVDHLIAARKERQRLVAKKQRG